MRSLRKCHEENLQNYFFFPSACLKGSRVPQSVLLLDLFFLLARQKAQPGISPRESEWASWQQTRVQPSESTFSYRLFPVLRLFPVETIVFTFYEETFFRRASTSALFMSIRSATVTEAYSFVDGLVSAS